MFYGTLIFQQSSIICTGRHVGGYTLAFEHGGQNYFLLISCYLVKCLIVTLRCAVNVTTSSFQYFPWSLSVKFEFRKRKFIILKSHFGHVTSYELTHFKKMVRVWKPNLYYYPLIVFQRQNHITFTFIKPCHMTSLYKWPILAWSVFSPFSRVIGSRNKAGLTVNRISCHGNRPWICANRLLNNPEQFSIGHSWVPNTFR